MYIILYYYCSIVDSTKVIKILLSTTTTVKACWAYGACLGAAHLRCALMPFLLVRECVNT